MESGCSSSASSAPGGGVVQVCFPSVQGALLASLNHQRLEGQLCDLAIEVQGRVFRAHRCVLAASSPYFHDQVLLKNVSSVSLPSVLDPLAFDSVLGCAYTGRMSVLRAEMVSYVTVASFLQMWHIVDKITELLRGGRRPAPAPAPADARGATPSRQQSPSSTDFLYGPAGGGGEAEPGGTPARPCPPRSALLRPRPRATPPSSSALSRPSGEGDYSSCEEAWLSSTSAPSWAPQRAAEKGGAPRAQPALGPAPPRHRRASSSRAAGGATRQACGGAGQREEEEEGERVEPGGEAGVSVCPGRYPSASDQEGEQEYGEEEDEELAVAGSGAQDSRGAVDMELVGGAEAEAGGRPSSSCPSSPLPSGAPWQVSSWLQPGGRPEEEEEEEGGGEEEYGGEEEEEEEDAEAEEFGEAGRYAAVAAAAAAFGGDTYDEIEDGTGQVSQRPLLPSALEHSDFFLAGEPGPPPPPPPAPAAIAVGSPPSPSPSLPAPPALAGAPYTGKVHYCHCGKAYTLKSMRDRHVKMQHLNLRPFACPVCAKTFKMKHHLTKHLKTHGALRPYECGLCGKKVVWRDSFLRHQAHCARLAAAGLARRGPAPPGDGVKAERADLGRYAAGEGEGAGEEEEEEEGEEGLGPPGGGLYGLKEEAGGGGFGEGGAYS